MCWNAYDSFRVSHDSICSNGDIFPELDGGATQNVPLSSNRGGNGIQVLIHSYDEGSKEEA